MNSDETDSFRYKVEFVDDDGNPAIEEGAWCTDLRPPMPHDFTITLDPLGYSFCIFTDQGGIRVLPGGRITLHVDGQVIPWNGEHTHEISLHSVQMSKALIERMSRE